MKKFHKKKLIHEYKKGDKVDDIFVVKIKKKLSPYKNKEGCWFHLILSDSTGKSIDYKYWGRGDEEKTKKIYNSITPDSVVHVKGMLTEYRGKIQISTNEPKGSIKALSVEQYEKNEFIKQGKKDPHNMYQELIRTIEKVKHPQLNSLLKSIFEDPKIKDKVIQHPGSIQIHHAHLGGLLEHTLEVVKYCELSHDLFPNLNKDLLLTGALLHDIGKLEEIKVTSRIKGTNKGQLSGHLVLGTIFISKKMDQLDIDKQLKDKIRHLVISHHGKNEYGSPKEPMIPEAMAIYYADELSAKLSALLTFIDNAKKGTEDDFMYHKREGRNIYLK